MVSYFYTFTWSYLELPLSWHSFSVRSCSFYTSIQASFVMGIHYRSTIATSSTYWAIIGALRSWESMIRPSKWLDSKLVIGLEESVLLFNTKPRMRIFRCFKYWYSKMPKVSICRYFTGKLIISPYISLTKDYDIILASERIVKESYWFENNLWVVSRWLIGWATIIIPFRYIFKFANFIK